MKTNLLISAVKNNLLLSSAIVAGGVGLFYLVRRMRANKAIPEPATEGSQHTRHLTRFFSKAKNMA